MTYLLDTCILSKLRKIKKFPDPILEKWLSKHPETAYFISALTLGEIQSGISKLRNDEKVKRMVLEDWLFGELITRFKGRILEVNTQVALTWGVLTGNGQQNGKVYPLIDGLIASTAMVHGKILVTENIKDFERMQVNLLNPWAVD